jgi:hypothetical protein
MLVKSTTKLYACVTDDGTYVPETVLTEPEFNNPIHRHGAESVALAAGCSRVRWEDVTDKEEFWLDDAEQFVLTERGREFLLSASIA